jgi:hypothetical protein|tara:strand:+ start:426 stop:614 length:189 start_codon:yes stop_codon:yes gene_type:complete
MTGTMEKINCSCGSAKEQVINAEKNVRVGWYCPSCRAFTKAIGREKVWRPHNKIGEDDESTV